MNTLTLALGIIVLMCGAYVTFLRMTAPHKLGKLAALKELFGDSTGNLIHLVAYSIIPFIAGTIFIVAGVRGVSLFG